MDKIPCLNFLIKLIKNTFLFNKFLEKSLINRYSNYRLLICDITSHFLNCNLISTILSLKAITRHHPYRVIPGTMQYKTKYKTNPQSVTLLVNHMQQLLPVANSCFLVNISQVSFQGIYRNVKVDTHIRIIIAFGKQQQNLPFPFSKAIIR